MKTILRSGVKSPSTTRPTRRLTLEPLEDRRLLAPLITLGGTATPPAVDPGGESSVAIQLSATPDSSSLKGFSLGIFLNANDLAQVALADFSAERRITVPSSTEEEYLPDISIADIYGPGYQNAAFLFLDTQNLDGNSDTDWYLQITWVDTSGWVSGNVSRCLANLSLTLKNEFGQMAATVPVDYRWLDQNNAPSWEVETNATEIFVNGQLAPPEISSVAPTDVNRFDKATVTWDRVAGAASYMVEYSTSDRFLVQATKSVSVSDTTVEIAGLLPGTNYYFRVTAQSVEPEYNSIVSSVKDFRTAAAEPDLAVSTASFPASVEYGDSFAINGLTVTNNGNGPSDEYAVLFYASTDAVFDSATDILLGSVKGGPLDFSASGAISANFATTGLVSGQSYYLIWTVAPENDVIPDDNAFVSETTIEIKKIPLAAPVLNNTSPKIGDTLSVSFTDTQTTAAIQWSRYNSVSKTWNPIPNATSATYNITAEDFGNFLRVEVTGNGNYFGMNYVVTDTVTDELKSAYLSSGSPTVGTALSVSFTANYTIVSSEDATTFSYVWYADETEVSTESTYTPTGNDVGKTISVEVTGMGNWTGSLTLIASKFVMRSLTSAAFSFGLPLIGDTLSATLEQSAAAVNYTWFRVDSSDLESEISGEASSDYRVKEADLGSRLRLKIVGDETQNWTGEMLITSSAVIAPVTIQANETIQLGCDLYLSLQSDNPENTRSNWTCLWDLDGDDEFETENAGAFLASSLSMGGLGSRTLSMKIRDNGTLYESKTLTFSVTVTEAPQTLCYAYDMNNQTVRLQIQENSIGAAPLDWKIDWGDGFQETLNSVSRTIKTVHYYQPSNESRTVRVQLCNANGLTNWYDLFSYSIPSSSLTHLEPASYVKPSAIEPPINEQAAPSLTVSPIMNEPLQPVASIVLDEIFAASDTGEETHDALFYDLFDTFAPELPDPLLSELEVTAPLVDKNAEQNRSPLDKNRSNESSFSQSNSTDSNLAINLATKLSFFRK